MKKIISFSIDEKLLEKLDTKRGLINRSIYLRKIIKEHLEVIDSE